MKKLLGVVLVLVVLVGAGMIFLVNNLDGLVKRAIETAGTDALGTPVTVQSVSIDLGAGSASLNGFAIANPPGFSDQDMMRFDELSVGIDIRSLTSDVIRITSISSVNPYVLYEMQGMSSNINAIMDRFPAQEPAPETEPAGPQPVIAIDALTVNGIQGSLQSDRLPRAVNVNLGNVAIPAVQGTPEELARQIARPLLTQLARNAGNAMTSALEGELRGRVDEATEQLRSEAEQRAQELEQQAEEEAQNAVQGLRDRIGI